MDDKNLDDLYFGTVSAVDSEGPWTQVASPTGITAWAATSELRSLGLGPGDPVTFRVIEHENGSREALIVEQQPTTPMSAPPGDATPVASQADDWTAETGALSEVAAQSMATGVVKWFDASRGMGYIVLDDGGEDLRVDRSGISDERYRNLVPTEKVSFTRAPSPRADKKPRATGVMSLLPSDRHRGFVVSFDHGVGQIKPVDEDTTVRVHFSSIMGRSMTERTLREGEEVEYRLTGSKEAKEVKRLDSRYPLYRFAAMGRDDLWLPKLARLAQGENWEYSTTKDKYPVLRSYFVYTFNRLQEEHLEGKNTLAFGEQQGRRYAAFNTGLVTEFQERIYALFHAKDRSSDGCEWQLDDFCRGSDEKMHGKFDRLPLQATYWTNAADLVYDHLTCELHINYRHVARDRIDRFPEYINGNVEEAAHLLETVCSRAVDRVVQNYKVAVPQYYKGEIQLLLPICLKNPSVADLALVVSRNGQQYRGDTALLLDQAYNNARLLTRPDREWLHP